MKPKAVKLTVGLASSCALVVSPTLVGNAMSPTATQVPSQSFDDKLEAASAKLSTASKKVRAAKLVLEETNKKLPAAKQKVAKAQADYAAAQARTAAAQAKVKEAEAETAKAEVEIAKVKEEILKLREHVGILARAVYVNGGNWQELEMLLEASTPSEFAERLVSYRRVAKSQNNSLDRLAEAQARLGKLLEKLEKLERQAQEGRDAAAKAQGEAQAAAAQATKYKAELDALVARRARALKDARSDRDQVKSMYDNLLAAQRAALAASAAKSNTGSKRPGGSNGGSGGSSGGGNSGGHVPTGSLSWPLPGYSAGGRTGPRVHPVYGYSSCHTGDDIGAPSGTPIKAAAGGTVISASYGSVYGNNIMISHGNGLVTMYAHQSRMAVSSGQKVSRGQTIGYVGSTGYSTGPHLHFEVHVNGVPYEPMGWFGGSKYRVTCWNG